MTYELNRTSHIRGSNWGDKRTALKRGIPNINDALSQARTHLAKGEDSSVRVVCETTGWCMNISRVHHQDGKLYAHVQVPYEWLDQIIMRVLSQE